MHIFLSILGMAAGIAMIKYRQQLGDLLGDAYWMRYVGGIYNFMMLLGVLLFFISIAKLTGTTHIIFSFLGFFVPGEAIIPE